MDRGPAAPWLRFVAVAIGSGIAFWAIYGAFVLTEAGQRSENLALLGAVLRSEADREASLGRLSLISVVSFGIATVLVFLAATIRGRSRLGLLAVAVMAGAIVAAEILKELLPRPALVEGPAWILRNDFPSGTSTIAAGIGVAMLLVSPDRLRWLALPPAALTAALIGQATQVAGWHRLSGAVGGTFLVVAIAAAGLAILARAGLVGRSTHGRVSSRVRGLVIGLGSILILVGAVVLAVFLAFPLLRAPEGASSAFLHTVFDAVGSGATVLVIVAFAVVIEPYALGVRDERADQSRRSPVPPIRPIRPGGP
ncbi:MAG: hypothetical protein AB1736_06620 [Chloroflexota bacterium]